MAIARLKKIEILGHSSQRDRLLQFLQEGGQVQVIDLTEKSDEYTAFSFEQRSVRYEEVSEAAEKLSWLMSFFEGIAQTKRSALAPKPVLRRREVAELLDQFDYAAFHKRCRQIESSLRSIENRRMELASRSKELLPWVGLDIPLDAVGETEFTASTLGCVRRKDFPSLREGLQSSPGAHLEVVNADRVTVYLFVVYLKTAEEEVAEVLRQHEFAFHRLPRRPRCVDEILKEIEVEEEKLQSEHLARLQDARSLLSEETKVAALLDHFSNLERKEGAKANLLYSEETFLLQGWIKEQESLTARKTLQERFDTVEVYVSDPGPEDELPVVLENRNVLHPFEFLTGIYGYPAYQDVDPTPFLAPFFFVFFGCCLGDAVYGLILIMASVFALKRFTMGRQGRRFFRLLLYCGLSATIVGTLTGNWLGDLLGVPAVLLNPLKKPIPMLNLALVMGMVQIWTGYAVAAYGNVRRKQYLDAVLDQLPIFLLLSGLTGIGLIFLKTLPAEAMKVCLALVGVASITILAARGRNEPSRLEKALSGGLSWYTAVFGYLSDVLSYSRLWALGLVTGAMASAFNFIAATMSKAVPIVGFVFAAIILAWGHVITLLIGTLGAFVHTIRLQFVEFFSKFFRSTGKPFEPLAIENRFTVIEE